MANSSIPLSIQNLDIQPMLQARQQGANNQRQARIDQMGEQQFAQSTAANSQQMKANQMQIDKAGLQMIATDAQQFDQMVQSDNLQGAAQIGQKIKGTMQRYGMDTSEADNLLRLFNNPPALKQASAQMIQRLAPMAESLFSDVTDKDGNIIAQRKTQTNEWIPVAGAGGAESQAQFGGQVPVQDANGNLSFATTKRNPQTGQVETVLSPIGEGMQMVGPYGETGQERTGREIAQVTGTTAAKGEEERASGLIERATAAAESTAVIRRGLQLLETVETGGIEAVSLAMRQKLGIEGADEGELSNSLGKAVLGQLRETFGAAFTENEGARLSRIEAEFNKSPANNKRLLGQALRIAENTTRRGITLAESRGQKETVADLQDLLTFSLDVSDAPPAGGNSGIPTVTNKEQFDALPIGARFIEDGVELVKQ